MDIFSVWAWRMQPGSQTRVLPCAAGSWVGEADVKPEEQLCGVPGVVGEALWSLIKKGDCEALRVFLSSGKEPVLGPERPSWSPAWDRQEKEATIPSLPAWHASGGGGGGVAVGGHVGAYARRLGCLVTRLAPPILCLQSRLWSGVCQVGGSESSIRPTPVTWARPCHPQKASCSQIPWGRGARAGWRPSELWLPGLGVCRPPLPLAPAWPSSGLSRFPGLVADLAGPP